VAISATAGAATATADFRVRRLRDPVVDPVANLVLP